jgi:hypothetical protein
MGPLHPQSFMTLCLGEAALIREDHYGPSAAGFSITRSGCTDSCSQRRDPSRGLIDGAAATTARGA